MISTEQRRMWKRGEEGSAARVSVSGVSSDRRVAYGKCKKNRFMDMMKENMQSFGVTEDNAEDRMR